MLGRVIATFFADREFQYGLEAALGAAYRGAADIGEVLATVARIVDGDANSWLDEWIATAGAAWAAGRTASSHGRRASALSHFRRAATYYATALCQVGYSSEPDRRLGIWRRQRACWERSVDLSRIPGERVAISYEHTSLPGYFFRAADAAPGEPRPLVVVNNGSDGATSQMWLLGGAAASERGYHWMTFDGPGQQAALFDQGLRFRPDWEAVLTPVVDVMSTRADVDETRMAVIGVGQGGYWVPRALAFEHRFAAAVTDPGVVDVSTHWIAGLPASMREQLRRGDHEAFDREMHLVELFDPATKVRLDLGGAAYGVDDGSRYRLFETVTGYRLDGELASITTPLLVTDPEAEPLWRGQSRQLCESLPGIGQLVRFTKSEGAGRHCEPLALALRDSRIFDWLDGYLT